jgi:hypothetical protein
MTQIVFKVQRNEQPSLIDSSVENVIYVGYPQNGAGETDAKWAIKKIEVVAGVTSIKWSNGNVDKNCKWSERAALTYKRI